MTGSGAERWLVDDLTVDVGSQTVTRGGTPIALPQLSLKFLLALVRASPNVLSVDMLMEQVWAGVFVNAETVTQRAKLLRDALGDDPKEPRYFTVRRGTGYQLVAKPERLDTVVDPPAGPASRPASWWKAVFAALILTIVATGGLLASKFWPEANQNQANASIRVAVLPFDNLSSNPSDAYIARSIPEMVLNRLSSVRGLTVIARDTALLSPVSSGPLKNAGQSLQAAFIVKGSVQRTGATLRVTCFVVDTANETRLWSERFDWPVDRLYALQDRIADRVATSLAARTRGIGELAPAVADTRIADAYLAYLKGKALLGRFTVAQTDAAAQQFERAVNLDPDFAAALVALFDARMQAADLRREDLDQTRSRYQPLLDKALRIAPNSGEALFAKAMWVSLPQVQKAALFRRATELDPSNSRGLIAYAQFLGGSLHGGAYEGIGDGNVTRDGVDGEERKRLLARVVSIDPLNSRAQFVAIMQKLGELTPEQLEREQARLLEEAPENYPLVNRYATRRWMFHGQSAKAIELMERIIATDPQNPRGPHDAVAFYLDANDPAGAIALAATTPASRESTRALLAQFRGDPAAAGQAAFGPRGFLFNLFQNWLWVESVRDMSLRTEAYDLGAEAIATRYGFDLRNPRTQSLPQSTAAPALAHILIAAGKRPIAERLLAQTIQWIDDHPHYGLVGVYRTKAAALMLLGQRDQALSNLKASIETGHDIRHWWYLIEHDPIWQPVHGDPRFRSIAEFCRQAAQVERAKLDELRRLGKVPLRQAARRT